MSFPGSHSSRRCQLPAQATVEVLIRVWGCHVAHCQIIVAHASVADQLRSTRERAVTSSTRVFCLPYSVVFTTCTDVCAATLSHVRWCGCDSPYLLTHMRCAAQCDLPEPEAERPRHLRVRQPPVRQAERPRLRRLNKREYRKDKAHMREAHGAPAALPQQPAHAQGAPLSSAALVHSICGASSRRRFRTNNPRSAAPGSRAPAGQIEPV